jgi:hypothetical protein
MDTFPFAITALCPIERSSFHVIPMFSNMSISANRPMAASSRLPEIVGNRREFVAAYAVNVGLVVMAGWFHFIASVVASSNSNSLP